MSEAATEALFSYGTLQLESVQRATFGRLLAGAPDALVGYRLDKIPIADPAVIAASGKTHHPIVRATGKFEDTVRGMVFEVTPAELAAADAYEVDDYVRVRVTLASGRAAWVYAAAEARSWRLTLLEPQQVVLVDGAGELTMADLIARADATLAFGREHRCTRFVFDDRKFVPRLTTGEIYALPAALEKLGWTRTLRIANVYDERRPAAVEEYRMFSGISVSRGFAYLLFTDLDAALAWAAAP